MAVSAPPRPGPSVDAEPDRFEALIEEARQRARRRRQTYGTVALGIAAVVAATVALNRPDASHSEPPGLDIPAGAATTASPTAELVASMHLWHAVSAHGDVWLYLYVDGRLIWGGGYENWRERRLTPDAVAGVQEDIISTGLFDPDRRPPGSHQGPSDIQVRNGDRLVNLAFSPDQDWTPEFHRLARRLATLQSWLPATAWTQSEPTPYVPARYAVCAPTTRAERLERAEILSQLPAAAAAVLETANVPPWDDILPGIDPAGHQRRPDDGLCFDLIREDAQRLARSLDNNVDLASDRSVAVAAPGSETIGLLFISILPHGAPECACYS